MKISINADLGEGEPLSRTRAILRWIDLANIACGGHAGTITTMEQTIDAALAQNVKPGAHPGMPAAGDFGRGNCDISPGELRLLLVSQISTVAQILRAKKARLNHVKLHGTLYHRVEQSPVLAAEFLETMHRYFRGAKVIARLGGEVEKIAPALNVRVLREAFADRGYCDDGTLIPRGQPGSMLDSPRNVRQQIESFLSAGVLGMGRPDTLCVHGDTPRAVAIAKAAADVLNHNVG